MFPLVKQLNAQLVHTLTDEELVMLDKALTAIQKQAEGLPGQEDLPMVNRRLGGRFRPSIG